MAPTLVSETRVYTILIVDDHPIVRDGLAAQVATQRHLAVCGEAEDIATALSMFEKSRPDIVIVDISLRSGSGLDLIRRLRLRDTAIPIVVWSMYPENLYAERALRAGAKGYVNKGSATRDILLAIREVLAGRLYVSQDISAQLVCRVVGAGSRTIARSPIDNLSNRELEAFELMGQGLTTEKVAETMHVCPKTVETYRTRIKEKLGLNNMHELMQRSVRWVMENT
jgi:DNA-binding NarL/FixJ family response regulator